MPWPIEKYISTSRIGTENRSRFFSFGVSRSFSASASAHEGESPEDAFFSAPFSDAPYPAASTARMIASEEAVPSTPMEFVSRLTAQDVTPGTPRTAFSTRLEQAAQLMPVTLYCSITDHPQPYFISFCSVPISSSIASSRPARMSSVTQVRRWLVNSTRQKLFSAELTADAWVSMSGQ